MLRLTLLSCENYGVQKFVRGKMSRVTILSFVLIMAIHAVFARLPNCKEVLNIGVLIVRFSIHRL